MSVEGMDVCVGGGGGGGKCSPPSHTAQSMEASWNILKFLKLTLRGKIPRFEALILLLLREFIVIGGVLPSSEPCAWCTYTYFGLNEIR